MTCDPGHERCDEYEAALKHLREQLRLCNIDQFNTEANLESMHLRLVDAIDGFKECMNDHATTLERLDAALELLKKHGIHVEESWCWCSPKVSMP
jgi:hypothetical protein